MPKLYSTNYQPPRNLCKHSYGIPLTNNNDNILNTHTITPLASLTSLTSNTSHASYNTNITNLNSTQVSTTPVRTCRGVALTGFDYCRFHIKLYPAQYKKLLEQQKALTQRTKYNFLDADIRKTYIDKLGVGSRLYDLREDIALLTLLLEKVVNNKDIDNMQVLKIIDLQRKCLATMNDIRRANFNAFTQDKLETFVRRITDVINKNIVDIDTRKAIALEFISVGKEYGTGTRE